MFPILIELHTSPEHTIYINANEIRSMRGYVDETGCHTEIFYIHGNNVRVMEDVTDVCIRISKAIKGTN